MALRRSIYWMGGLAATIAILGAIVAYQHFDLQHSERFLRADAQVQLALAHSGMQPTTTIVSTQGLLRKPYSEITVDLPASASLEQSMDALNSALVASKLQVLSTKELTAGDDVGYFLHLGVDETPTHLLFIRSPKAQVALLFDDFGYTNNRKLLDAFFAGLNVPFSVAIIPGTTFAVEIAEVAHDSGKEILVHMPMQPQGEYVNDYQWMVCQGMTHEEIRTSVHNAIASVPYARGLNNHMGSFVTTRKDLITPVLEVVQEDGLYFVDSRTISSSIAHATAQELNVATTYNCVFLDNEKNPEYIRNQFRQLVSLALEQGWAVGLGHCHPTTVSAIKDAISSRDNPRVRYVNISEIVE